MKSNKNKINIFIYKLIDKIITKRGISQIVPSKFQIKVKYFLRLNKKISFSAPRTFGEKLQWLKLYDRKPKYSKMVDKYLVRDYVSSIIGSNYLIPIIGVYKRFSDIDFSSLPNQFVLKCTHDSGGVVICRDKKSFNIDAAKNKINKHLKTNYFWSKREWPYKHIHPKIICEEYMEDVEQEDKSGLVDYKFYCFNGEPYYCQVIKGREASESIDFFDMNWNHMPFVGTRNLPNYEGINGKPEKLEELCKLSKLLSEKIPFVRVDFYVINKEIYFGELTFFPSSGMGKFYPEIWNYKLGDLIKLPNI